MLDSYMEHSEVYHYLINRYCGDAKKAGKIYGTIVRAINTLHERPLEWSDIQAIDLKTFQDKRNVGPVVYNFVVESQFKNDIIYEKVSATCCHCGLTDVRSYPSGSWVKNFPGWKNRTHNGKKYLLCPNCVRRLDEMIESFLNGGE